MSGPSLMLPLVVLLLGLAGDQAPAQDTRAISPETAEQLVKAGDGHALSKKFDKAVEAYSQALKLNPELAAAYHGLGSAYINMGRLADAHEPLRTAVRLDPNNAIAHLNLGICLSALRRADDAMLELNEARRLSPRDPRIHNEIGNALHNNFGRIEEALDAYRQARELNPSVPSVHHNVGLMLMRLGRFGEAVGPLEEALRLSPGYQNARYHLSHAYNRLGRYEESAQSWSKFLQIRPRGPEALQNRAWNLLYTGAGGEAAAADALQFLEVAGWKNDSAQFMVMVAHLSYRQAGRETDAAEVIKKAMANCNTAVWPYPIIKYLKREISAEELLKLAEDTGKKTEVRTYIGMDLLLRGEVEEARAHLVWVKEYGNKQYLEYPLAMAELNRLGDR